VIGNASGAVTSSDVSTISVTCTTNTYALRGTVSGLSPSQFREPLLLSNGADEVEVLDNGLFTMANVPSGQAYEVEIETQPAKPSLSCSVLRSVGAVSNGDVTDVAVTCEPAEATFVYATSYVQALSILRIAPDHSLQPVEEMATVNTPTSVTVDSSGQFVYLATMDAQGTILAYAIDSATGRLTQIGTGIVTGATPREIITDPSGEFAFVGNQHGGLTSQGSISVFAIDAITGGLTEVAGSEFTNGQAVYGIGTDPSGRFVYTANAAGYTAGSRVDRVTGALTALPGSSYSAAGVPLSIAVDPQGRFVYTIAGAAIYGYSIDPASGSLTPLQGSPFASTDNRIVMHPSGRFLYNLFPWNPSTSHIAGYSIDADGTLTPMPGPPFADANMPESGAFDPTGRYLYVTEEAGGGPTAGGVKVYQVDPVTGSLSVVSSTPVQIPANPTSIAVR
jgi:6-phosphogluconolactonase (cycloisomerase 2 family)